MKSFYQNFNNLFGQPLVCLMSPTSYPKSVQGETLRLFRRFPFLDQSMTCQKSFVEKKKKVIGLNYIITRLYTSIIYIGYCNPLVFNGLLEYLRPT